MIEPNADSLPTELPFGLTAAPFADSADGAFFFPAEQHVRAIEFLGRALWTKSTMAVVTAERGGGKSVVVNRLLRELDDRLVVASIQREHLNARDFLTEIARQFGLPLDDNDKTDRRKLLERFLAHQASLGRVCVVIVENPQSMSPAALEELRCLACAESEQSRILKVLLLGQPSLNLVLESPRMTSLCASAAPRFVLSPLSEDQTAAYIAHRLRAAGAANPDFLMPSALMPQIHACTGGMPAQINRVCETLLSEAWSAAEPQVTVRALDAALDKLKLTHRKAPAAAPLANSSESAARPRLVVSMQGHADREFTLAADRLLVGRGEEADIRIDSVFVSRYHALIVRHQEQDLMIDLGSTNGLLVNSRRIARRALRHRDLIQVGPVRLMYFNERLAESPTPDPGETICFARPGFPQAAGEDDSATLLAFARLDESAG